MNRPRKQIEEELGMETRKIPKNLSQYIDQLVQYHKEGWTEIMHYGYDIGAMLRKSRPETDEEYNARCAKLDAAIARKKKSVSNKRNKDLKEYERLKKKLGL